MATAIAMALLIVAGASSAIYFAERANEQRRVSQASKLTSESIVALKQESNPTKATSLATSALLVDSSNVSAWGALLETRYSQTFRWRDRYFSVPFSKTFTLSGTLGAADLSADGKILVAGSWDPFLAKMWLLDEERDITFAGFSGPIWRVRFSPNDSTFMVAPSKGQVRIYDRAGIIRCRLPIPDLQLTDAEFSPDGKYAITGFDDGTATIWRADSGTKTVRLTGEHVAPITSVCFSPDNHRILTASADGRAVVWNEGGRALIELPAGSVPLSSAVFSPDGLHIVTTSETGEALIWQADGRKLAGIERLLPLGSPDRGFQIIFRPVVEALWSPDGSYFITYSENGNLKLSRKDGGMLRSINAHDGRVRGVRFASVSRNFISYGDDNTIKIWAEGGPALHT